jgi:hypothetical protein
MLVLEPASLFLGRDQQDAREQVLGGPSENAGDSGQLPDIASVGRRLGQQWPLLLCAIGSVEPKEPECVHNRVAEEGAAAKGHD